MKTQDGVQTTQEDEVIAIAMDIVDLGVLLLCGGMNENLIQTDELSSKLYQVPTRKIVSAFEKDYIGIQLV